MAMMGATPMGMQFAPPPPPPPISPMQQYMAARAAQYTNPIAQQQGGALGASSAFLDPNRAGGAAAQMALGGPSALGGALSTAGTIGAFLPGGQVLGTAMAMGGQGLGDIITNNPLTRWGYEQMYGSSIQDMTNMARLQHGTAGLMNLAGGGAGPGGTMMSATGAMRLGQQFRGQGQRWARANPELAAQMGGGDADVGAQRYTQDLTNLTQMAGEFGLLDAAANIEQVGDTVRNLFKVLGKMGEITGDPDFRNNLRQLATMRQAGLSIEQAATATQYIQRYQQAGGMTGQQLAGAQQMGMNAFAQAGMAPGVGMMYGPQAQLQARQLAGAFNPMQEALLGGQEGIAQRWATQQAQFATGPMNMMMGAAMTAGPGGALNLDPGRMAEMLRGGTTLAGLAGQAQGNMMQIAQQVARQQNRPVQDVMVEIMQRQPELQSQVAQQLGPEGMRMLQMRTVASLARPGSEGGMGLGLHTAAQMVTGGDPQQAQMLVGMMTSPEFYQRERDRLNAELRDTRRRAREEASTRREWRARQRDNEWEQDERETVGFVEAMNAAETERLTRLAQRQEDRARGVEAAYLTETMSVDPQIAQEITEREYGDVLQLRRNEGLPKFERARRLRNLREQGRFGEAGGITTEEVRLAQQIRGETGVGAFLQRQIYGAHQFVAENLLGVTMTDVHDPVVEETKRTRDRVFRDATIIEANKERGVRDLSSMLKNLRTELTGVSERGGIDDVDQAMAGVQQAVLSYAERVGRGEDGTTFSHAKAREEIVKQLQQSGMDPREAERAVSTNKDFWDRMTSGVIRTHGTPTQMAAFEETVDKAVQFMELTPEKVDAIQKSIDDAQENYEDVLDKAGVTDRAWYEFDELVAQEKEALRTFTEEKSPEVQEAMMLMAMRDAGGLDEETTADVNKRLFAIRERNQKVFDAAGKALANVKEKSGDKGAGVISRLYKLAGEGPEALEGLRAALKRGREGAGDFGVLYAPGRETAKALAQGFQLEGQRIIRPETTPAGGPAAGEATAIEKQISNLDEMQKQFAGFGRSAQTLQIAAAAQIKAAEALGGEKVSKFLQKFYEDNK